jgi:hypothetical protein
MAFSLSAGGGGGGGGGGTVLKKSGAVSALTLVRYPLIDTCDALSLSLSCTHCLLSLKSTDTEGQQWERNIYARLPPREGVCLGWRA